MAGAIADGAASVDGVEVVVKRVPVLVPEEAAKSAGIKLEQDAPIAEPSELADYDAIIFGATACAKVEWRSLCKRMLATFLIRILVI